MSASTEGLTYEEIRAIERRSKASLALQVTGWARENDVFFDSPPSGWSKDELVSYVCKIEDGRA